MIVKKRYGRETGREYALRVLKENIVMLELEPGSRISENELASEIGVSRTPIREALIELSKSKHNGKEKVIYASWKHSNTENYKFSWNKKYVMYWGIPGICGE